MISRQRTVVSFVVISLVLLAGVETASAERRQRIQNRTEPTELVAAFAALEPVGERSGWGRIEVRDERQTSGSVRTVDIRLCQMTPNSTFEIDVQGMELAAVTTDGDGYAELAFSSTDKGQRVLPVGFPSAADLESVTVLDESLAAVLEGRFTVIRHAWAEFRHSQRIALVDVTGGGATGVAAVGESDAGEQAFITHASGLVPGTSYTIVVDGFPLAIVIADAEGQASLEMVAPAEENPIPAELLPVSEIRIVEWYLGDDLLLWGAFSGDPECETLRGEIQYVEGDEILIRVADTQAKRRIWIKVTRETQFREFEELSDLGAGDVIVVEGCWRDEMLVASWILLAEPYVEPECDGFRAVVEEVGADKLVLRPTGDDRRAIVVRVSGSTELEGFDRLSDLSEGDVVAVEACPRDEVLVADWIRLLEEAQEPEWWETDGVVTAVFDGSFNLDTGEEILRVSVGDGTEYVGLEGVHQLGIGDVVFVEGPCDGESLDAAVVKLVEAAD